MSNKNIISTKNKKGFSYPLNPFGKEFLEFASECKHPIVDIGAAFGCMTIPALENGAEVIAVDIEKTHLEQLKKDTSKELQEKLTIINGRFPEIDFPENSIGGIYISQVFPHISCEDIEIGIEKILKWLVPGGKICVISFTPFIKFTEAFLPVYEEKLKKGCKWAGYLEDVSKYTTDKKLASQLPPQLGQLDKHDLERAFKKFNIEKLEYFGECNNDLPPNVKLDGRERIGLIASKPQ